MSDIVIRFDLRLGAAWRRGLLTGLLLLTVAPELGSESVTLSTYYPAPSGVYTNMITTSNTYLARDGGNVGVGTSAPSAKLHVNGTTRLGGAVTVNPGTVSITPAAASIALDVAQNSTIRVGQSYLSSGGPYMHLGMNAYYNGSSWTGTGANGSLLQFDTQNVRFYSHTNGTSFTQTMLIQGNGDAYHYGAVYAQGSRMDVSGTVIARNAGSCTTAHIRTYATTGATSCPGGTYATMYSGIMSKYVVMPRYADVNGFGTTAWMLCCPCPSGGCPAL
jgi:hypothetical protein